MTQSGGREKFTQATIAQLQQIATQGSTRQHECDGHVLVWPRRGGGDYVVQGGAVEHQMQLQELLQQKRILIQ
eukprot:CAMPEP_0114435666 /NCGR_PEP_ID=MMETSP0103-20121206/12969_1 /TAXON_ID=37642 ORGANISM="Paraphysomonas imperforata, Strain PA2" /NCGR_SAMPLE_ID=MMETSP0103 /ASSEMBLY_ACC=CAM_ASM_000201 /LENGTH=72 /DNA_ID=CAMNT_0001605741 /DNA_START=150 /DNA_END=365 /DNA_ORIENTATION=-